MKKIFTLAAAVLASLSLTWADPTVEILNSNFTQWATTPPENSGLSNKNTYTITDGVSNVATVVGNGCKLNDTKNTPTSTGITGYNTNKFRFGSSGNYLYITPAANFIEGGKIRLLISSEKTSESDILGTVYIGESHNLGNIHGWTAKATCDWQEFDIPASVTGTTAEIRITRTDNTLFLWGIQVLTNEDCIDSESTIKGDTTLYVNNGYNIGFNSINTNGCTVDVQKNGAAAVDDVDYSKTNINNYTFLKAGEYVITISQAKDANNHCAVEESVTVTVLDASPVSAVTIAGPTEGYAGNELTYTATAANATDYQWLVDGVDANTNAATFKYTAVKGSHSIVCKARNEFNGTGEWVESDPIALTVTSLYGQLIAADAETGSDNIDKDITATGIVGGTVHQKTQKNAKLGGEGLYFSLTLAAGSFAAGDTVKVVVTPEYNSSKDTYSAPTQLKISTAVDNSNLIGESDTKVIDPKSSDDLYFDIVLTEGASTIYLARDGSICKQNPIVKSISVVRPMPVKSTSEAFKSVSVNGEALVANFDANHAMTVEDSYVDAPVVVFTKTVTTIYEDNSQVVKDVEVEVTAEEVAGAWQAQATINSVTYTINAAKAASFTVHYMDGTTELGTENVAVNGTVADYAKYQSKQLASFVGWYQDVDLTVEAILTAPITAETHLYAKFENKYATSINIEKTVMENSKGYDIIAQLGTLGYASNITGSLDSLSVKDDGMRNYAYLGLKVKQNGALLNFRLAAGNTVTIKFGEIKKTPNVSINGGDYADMVITNKVYTHTAGEADELISIKMMDGNAVVFQQIMIGVELQAPELFAINCAEVENGTVAAPFKMGIPGEEVELTFTSAEGFIVMSCTVNGEEIHQSAPGAPITFEMPAADVTITTTFSIPTALENAEAAVKAEKVIRDGQVLILRDGKIFNALGAEVK